MIVGIVGDSVVSVFDLRRGARPCQDSRGEPRAILLHRCQVVNNVHDIPRAIGFRDTAAAHEHDAADLNFRGHVRPTRMIEATEGIAAQSKKDMRARPREASQSAPHAALAASSCAFEG